MHFVKIPLYTQKARKNYSVIKKRHTNNESDRRVGEKNERNLDRNINKKGQDIIKDKNVISTCRHGIAADTGGRTGAAEFCAYYTDDPL